MLQASEETLSRILSSIDEIVYQVSFEDDPLAGKVTFVSPRVRDILGFEPQEFLEDRGLWFRMLHPDDAASLRQDAQCLDQRRLPWTRQYRLKHKLTGEYRWMEDRAVLQWDAHGRPIGQFGAAHDITERKRTEDQLRELARRLQSIREDEQARIAREIHDELGQALTVLKIDLSSLRTKLGNFQPSLLEKTQQMIAVVDGAIEVMRRIVVELRPPMLEDLGLAPTVEWLVQRFTAQTRIGCQLALELDSATVDTERAVTAYRILQEALTNAARHARASNVTVRVGVADGDLLVEVRDDGRGITEQEVACARSLGLLGMRERARLWGGKVSVCGAANTGTTVTARIPLAP